MINRYRFLHGSLIFSLILTSMLQVPARAASTSDKALALASSGCLLGFISVNPRVDLLVEGVVISAVFARSDDDPNSTINIQNEHISESWNSASSLDPKWKFLLKIYNDINIQLDKEVLLNQSNSQIMMKLNKKFGGALRSNCKLAINSSMAKAKKARMSLAKWIYISAGSFLPRLSPNSIIN